MVETSLSGSGEGLGRATDRGYSTAAFSTQRPIRSGYVDSTSALPCATTSTILARCPEDFKLRGAQPDVEWRTAPCRGHTPPLASRLTPTAQDHRLRVGVREV